jgi:tetratricopeptide (TPR) repeat protein
MELNDGVNHGEWTDRLSEYLDGELPAAESAALESHLATCASCAQVLADLKRVVARAQRLEPRPPQNDLWTAIAAQIDQRPASNVIPIGAKRRVTFTLPQLAAAAVLLIAVSAGLAWTVADRLRGETAPTAAQVTPPVAPPSPDAAPSAPGTTSDDIQVATVNMSDPQYDAAVADLEKALKEGRGRLDANTIAIVEHNLQIIDQAIEQARQALAADPANSYLSSHLYEARRRKLDLLRRAAALSTESD